MTCSAACWTPSECPTCGGNVPPKGRSVPLAVNLPCCCADRRDSTENERHLWNEHDDARHYTDPEGWAAHQDVCEWCRCP